MAVCYAIGLPILFVMYVAIFTPWIIKLVIRDEYGLQDIKELMEAVSEGMKCGHRVNMHWVKYGNQPFDTKALN